jgi:hypothetical protein
MIEIESKMMKQPIERLWRMPESMQISYIKIIHDQILEDMEKIVI